MHFHNPILKSSGAWLAEIILWDLCELVVVGGESGGCEGGFEGVWGAFKHTTGGTPAFPDGVVRAAESGRIWRLPTTFLCLFLASVICTLHTPWLRNLSILRIWLQGAGDLAIIVDGGVAGAG